MSGLKKMIEALSNTMKFANRMKTVMPTPLKVRTYNDINSKKAFEKQTQESPLILPKLEEIDSSQELVLLGDIEKECVLTLMEYYEYLDTFTGEFQDNQGFIQKCHELYTRVSEDRPVKKEILYELCPELYTYELLDRQTPLGLRHMYQNLGLPLSEKKKKLESEKLSEKALTVTNKLETSPYQLTPPKGPEPTSHKYRVGKFMLWDPEDRGVQEIYHNEHYSPFEIKRRITYIWEEIKRVYEESADLIEKYESKLGSVGAVLSYLKLKGEKCNEEEKKMFSDIDYINRLMQEQYEFLQEVYDFHSYQVVMPFPMPDWLRDMFMESLHDVINNKMFDNLAEAMGIPDNSAKMIAEAKIREQKAYDAMVIDEKDRKNALKMIGEKGEEILVRRNLMEKDNELIRKMSLLSDTIKVEKPPEIIPDFSNPYNPEELRFKDNEKALFLLDREELYIENLIKILYLNNSDPQQYDLDFWTKHLNISPQRLKNIFYNFSHIITHNGQVIGKLSFIEVPKKKEVFDLYQESLKRELKKSEK